MCRTQAPVPPCWGGLGSHLVAMALCQDAPCPWQSLAALQCVLHHFIPSLQPEAVSRGLLCPSLCSRAGLDPTAVMPNISHPCNVSCPSAAAWLPGLPAASLPSLGRLMLEEEPAGPGGGKGSWQGVLRERMAGHSSQQNVILSHPQPRGVEFHPLVYSRAEGAVRGQLLGKLSDQGGPSARPPPQLMGAKGEGCESWAKKQPLAPSPSCSTSCMRGAGWVPPALGSSPPAPCSPLPRGVEESLGTHQCRWMWMSLPRCPPR